MAGRAAVLSGLVLATISIAAASAFQGLDVPEQPTFDDKIPKKKKPDRSSEQEFEVRGAIEFEKSSLVICSEGAASGADIEAALDACDAAIKERPDNGDAYYYRGIVLSHLDRHDDSERDFTAAIENNTSRLAESYFWRGVAKENQRRLGDAAADFKKASELKPEWSAARRKVDEYRWVYE